MAFDIRDYATQKAQEQGVDPDFVHRLINQESRWNPNAKSKVGALGLMQVMPATGKELGVSQASALLDPATNIEAGTKYLGRLAAQFGNNPHLISMAYNAGPGRVSKLMSAYGSTPEAIYPHLPKETQDYTIKVAGPISGDASRIPLPAHIPFQGSTTPTRTAELRTAPPESVREKLYNLMFSTENEGLPPAKTWVGPDEGLPPKQLTTGDLASLGTLALSGMAGGIPELGTIIPASFLGTPKNLIKGMLASTLGGYAGGEIGEQLGGDVGRDIGAGLGGLLPFPSLPTLKSDIVGIPPTGSLEGTKVLMGRGEGALAKPMAHGSPVGYQGEMDLSYNRNPEALLYGPGHYFTSSFEDTPTSRRPVAGGYAGYVTLEKSQRELDRATQQARQDLQKVKGATAVLENSLRPEDRDRIAKLEWQYKNTSTPKIHALRTYLDEIATGNKRVGIDDETNKIAARIQRYLNANDKSNRSTRLASIAADRHEETKATLGDIAPNIRPVYLNIKNPFDMDRTISQDQIEEIAKALTASFPKRPKMGESFRSVFQPEDEPANGDMVYQVLAKALKSKVAANNVLQKAGFDGITHIGGGRFLGGATAPIRHRVYIAFRDDQVKPYFSPEFSEEQAKREKAKALKQLIQNMKTQGLSPSSRP